MSAHHENGEQSQTLVPTTHFGYQEVPETEKEQLVRGVFSNVASKYDLMNDLMSLGYLLVAEVGGRHQCLTLFPVFVMRAHMVYSPVPCRICGAALVQAVRKNRLPLSLI